MRKRLFAIAALAFCLRLGYAVASGALLNPQIWEQEQMATNLVEHHEFVFRNDQFADRSYAEPLYPFMAAAVYIVTNHSRTALVLLQLVIAAATVWMTGRAAELATADQSVGTVAALLMAIHPGLMRYSSILHPFVLDTFFFITAAVALLRVREEPSSRRSLVAALVIGIGALTRPTILVFLAPLVWLVSRSAPSVAVAVRRATIVIAIAFAVVAPWTIRNAVVHHTFMLTRSGTGYVFWLGHNPATTGSAEDDKGRPLHKVAPDELQRRVAAAPDEVARNRIFADAAWAYIRAHPATAVIRVVHRFGYFWWFSPQWGRAYSTTAKLVYRAFWGLLLAFIGLGALASRAHPRPHGLWLMAALALLISIVQSVYYVEGRHRLAIEPLVMPLAAFGVISIARRWNPALPRSASVSPERGQ